MDKWLDFGKKYWHLSLSALLVILFLFGLFFTPNEPEWPEAEESHQFSNQRVGKSHWTRSL